MDDCSAADLFFAAQDAAEAGQEQMADELYAAVADADDDNEDKGGSHPPISVVKSMALNARAELALDRALASGFPMQPSSAAEDEQRAAIQLLQAAIRKCPENATALMNRALLARDLGDDETALQLWSKAAASPTPAAKKSGSKRDNTEGSESNDWREDWLLEPRRNIAPLACMYRALLLSQIGAHEEATVELRRLGYRWRLSPAVWDCARTPPPPTPPTPLPSHPPPPAEPARLYRNAVSGGVRQALRRAFAPGAAYWRETRYESAAASKRYFTFYVDLAELKERAESQRGAPTSAIERLLLSLLPLTGKETELRSCEWWVHQRAAGRGFGHELHYDLEEQTMEVSGRILHPTVSSVAYLSDGGDPTIVLDETIDDPLGASKAYCAHPECGAFLTFRGDLLHGVLPGPFARAEGHDEGRAAAGHAEGHGDGHGEGHGGGNGGRGGGKRAREGVGGRAEGGKATKRPPKEEDHEKSEAGPSLATAQTGQRLTLLVAWYAERTAGAAKRSRLGAQSGIPRPSRSMTWPRALELTAEEEEEEEELANAQDARTCAVQQVRLPEASPVWVRVGRPGEPMAAADRTAVAAEAAAVARESMSATVLRGGELHGELAAPTSLRQHFFLHSAGEVGDRLKAEHGIGGSWGRKGSRRKE